MMLRRLVVLIALAAMPAAAQIGRFPTAAAGPQYWVGLSLGLMNGTTINDGDSGGQWQFGYTSQIRATLEKTIQRGFSAGLGAGFSTAPLTYASPSLGFTTPATADVTQIMAFVHGGSGLGFHGIYNLEAGFTGFSNFREKGTDVQLPPTSAKYDFSFGFGGGLGYGISETADVYAGEMWDFVLHPQGPNSTGSAPQMMIFRGGFRVGF